jgi:hypothetical protein
VFGNWAGLTYIKQIVGTAGNEQGNALKVRKEHGIFGYK